VYLLDTNIVRNSLFHPESHPYLAHKIRTVRQRDQYISIVTAEELIAFRWGAIQHCNKTRSGRIVEAYHDLSELLEDFKRLQIVPFDDAAYRIFQDLAPFQTSIGTQDRRIAATALARDYTVVTANTQDFEIIPGLKVEDWTVHPPE
jgi:tRNA(fMet)-specific endonuclease VapC